MTRQGLLLEHWKLSGTTGGETLHAHLSGGAGAAFAGIYLHGLKALPFHLCFVVLTTSFPASLRAAADLNLHTGISDQRAQIVVSQVYT